MNLLQLATLLVGSRCAVPSPGRRAAAGPGCAPPPERPTRPASAASRAWACAGILGLAVVFVPSFIVSPGLNQKAFAARSPAAARAAALGNAAALAVFAFVPALLGMAMRAVAACAREP